MRNYEMKKTGNRIKTVRCLLIFMWFRQIISAGNVRRQILKLLSGAPAADEVNDQAFGNGLLPGVLLQTVQKVRRQINPKLKIEGILLTMTDNRTNYGQQIDNLIRGAYGSKIKVFDQTIPRSVRAAEISAVGKSIFQHDPKGKVAEAYQSLTKEVMANAERQLKHVAERGR